MKTRSGDVGELRLGSQTGALMHINTGPLRRYSGGWRAPGLQERDDRYREKSPREREGRVFL